MDRQPLDLPQSLTWIFFGETVKHCRTFTAMVFKPKRMWTKERLEVAQALRSLRAEQKAARRQESRRLAEEEARAKFTARAFDHSSVVSTRGTHRPEHRATATLNHLAEHYVRLFPNDPRGLATIFEPMWRESLGAVDGDDLLFNTWLGDSPDAVEFRALHTRDQFVTILATAYAVHAIKLDRAGDSALAWDYALDAAFWDGHLTGRSKVDPLPPEKGAKPRASWLHLLREDIEAIDHAHGGGCAAAEQAIRWLAANHPTLVQCDPPAQTLRYLTHAGGWKEITKKRVQNMLSKARGAAVIARAVAR